MPVPRVHIKARERSRADGPARGAGLAVQSTVRIELPHSAVVSANGRREPTVNSVPKLTPKLLEIRMRTAFSEKSDHTT